MAKLVEIGFTEKVATKALYWTGNSCSEVAVNWIFERNEKTLNTPLEIEVKSVKGYWSHHSQGRHASRG